MKTPNLKNSISRSPWRGGFLLIPLVLACFALLPRAQAETVSPLDAGVTPLETVTPQAETPSAVTPFPFAGTNTFDGFLALDSITTGIKNSAFGAWALQFNTTGVQNTAVGSQALRFNTVGSFNTAVGDNALLFNVDGIQNMALGQGALANNITGDNNVAMGFQALSSNTASNNVAVGFQALRLNSTGNGDTAVGYQALFADQTGSNTAVGFQALIANTDGFNNAAFGIRALESNLDGENNTAIGNLALQTVTSGSENTALGREAGTAVTTASDVICIGHGVAGENTSDRTYIGNIGTFTQAFSAGVNELVTVNLATGRLGHFNPVPSSRRYKEDIQPLDKTSEALFSLKPVSYRLKEEFDPTQALAFGLIAEEVEKVNPDLVSRNDKGQVESVRYEMVNAMMLNEFLKEHRTVQEQGGTIAELQKQVATLTATVKEQAAQIQKVSAQLQVSKPAPQTVSDK